VPARLGYDSRAGRAEPYRPTRHAARCGLTNEWPVGRDIFSIGSAAELGALVGKRTWRRDRHSPSHTWRRHLTTSGYSFYFDEW